MKALILLAVAGSLSAQVSFYPVDMLVNFNGASPGTSATAANLNASTETVDTGTWQASPVHMAFASAFATALPGQITVNGVGSHDAGYTGQSMAVDDSFSLYNNPYVMGDQTHQTVVFSGYVTSGPTTGGYDSFLVGLAGYVVAQAIQFGATNTQIHLHNAGAAAVINGVQPASTYYFSWLLDGSSPTAYSKFALYTDAYGTTKIGEVDYQLRQQVLSATYVSGGTATGTGTCNLAFDGTYTEQATGTVNVVSGVIGSTINIADTGTGITSPPTTAVLSNGNIACSGTVNVSAIQPGPLEMSYWALANNESSSQAGKTTNWQWVMVDWTNHVFPNLLHEVGTQPWSTFIDPSRAIDWSSVGFAIPNYTQNCATQPSLTPNSVTAAIANRTQMQTALASCDATHNVVRVPPGTFYIYGWNFGTQGKQVVRGAGPMATTILPTAYPGISMLPANYQSAGSGSVLPPSGTQQCLWTGGFAQGTTSITLGSCGGTPTSGQMMVLAQLNDSSDTAGVYICDSFESNCAVENPGNPDGPNIGGHTYSQQQVVWAQSVTSIGGGSYTMTISPGVYFNNVRIGQTPFVRWPNTVQLEGIENLTVDHSYVPPAPTIGTPTSGGSCTPGTHSMMVAFIYSESSNNIQSTPSAASTQFTCVASTGQTVPVTVPLGPTGTIARNISVTKAGDTGSSFLISGNTINDNTTTSYSFTTADASLSGIELLPNNTPISITNCYQCWIRNVRGLYAGRDHATVYQSLSAVIRDSYFYEAQTHGSQSYGIELTVASNTLIENNVFQTLVNPIMFGQVSGSVVGYNFSLQEGFNNTSSQTSDAGHNAGNGMNLFEGNNFFGIWSDDSWGSNAGTTLYRNMMRGWQNGKSSYTYAMMAEARNRAFNVVGNVLGQPSYHTHYESYATSNSGGVNGGAAADLSIYNLGWANIAACSGGAVTNGCDTLARSTLMRWGNYSTITTGDGAAGTTWDSTEASPAAVTYVGANFTSGYFGSLPHTLPTSLYYSVRPSWWPSLKAWPPVGPDVSTGNVGTCSGTYSGAQATASGQCTGGTLTGTWASHVNSIPAQDCYLSVMGGPPDGTGGVLNFDANACYYGRTIWNGTIKGTIQ